MLSLTPKPQDHSELSQMLEILDTTIKEPLKPLDQGTESSPSSYSFSLRRMILEEVVDRWREGLPQVKVTKGLIKVKKKSQVCGDQMTVLLKVDSMGIMHDIGIIANGCCCLSTGIAYHMVDYFKGKPCEAVEEMNKINMNDISPDIRSRVGCVSFPMGILYEAAQTAISQRSGSQDPRCDHRLSKT